MLRSFTITDPVYPIAFPDGNNTIAFATDKINLVCGLNGTGKSTLLSYITERFHAALADRTLICPHLTISKDKINLIALSDVYKDPEWLTKYIK